MLKRAGFTLVEIVIVMVIMAVLLTLTVVSLAGSQVNARDEERKADMEVLARALETRYRAGNPFITSPSIGAGSYPATIEMLHIMGTASGGVLTPDVIAGGYVADGLPGASNETLTSPTATSMDMKLINGSCIASGAGENMATITSAAAGCIGTTGKYGIYYESLNASGDICNGTDTCVRFNLYCRMEKDNSLMTIRSKRQ